MLEGMALSTLDDAAARLASVLMGSGGALRDPTGSPLEFEPELAIRPLMRLPAPADAWAVDGGQAVVADARCAQLVVVRASLVRFVAGSCVLEEEGELAAHLLGLGDDGAARASLGAVV